MEVKKEITSEDITTFIEGHDSQEHIVNILYNYKDDYVSVIYRNNDDKKCISKESFYPFLWATRDACNRLCNGDRDNVKALLRKFNVGVKILSNKSIDGEIRHEFDKGYMFMFYAKGPMSYTNFLNFFKAAQNPVYGKKDKFGNEEERPEHIKRQYLTVTPQEQYMISTGKRFFKGYDDYNDVLKLTFDLETEGLNTFHHRINQIGIKFNRPFNGHPEGFKKILTVLGNTKEEKDQCELWCIDQMLKIIYTFQPDIITAHNGENFDWNMIIGACLRLGTSLEAMSSKYFNGESIRKEDKESILKLGGEVEKFKRTIVPGIIVTDSLHAVRRAQATDSNFLKYNLKYATEYLGMKKENRVYVPGDKIDATWSDNEFMYAHNSKNGDWYKYDPECNIEPSDEIISESKKKDFIPTYNKVKDGYELQTGKYIVEQYLYDDLWECEQVEYKLNTTNFLICKLLPVTYSKATTMGTAGQWKMLMLAWSYEQGLAVPMAANSGSFTGGLSRLLRVGYIPNVIKLDYNSLYPSIILTWGICDNNDLMNSTLSFLLYVLTEREKYKGLKKKAGKIVDKYEERLDNGETLTENEYKEYQEAKSAYAFNDKKQSQMKVFGNSYFGSYGSNNGSVYPWKSPKCAEQTTCIGRQCLRLMISHFSKLGYAPIVGDSFTSDTPLFIKYDKSDYIDIKPIEELIENEFIEIDALGREYDYKGKNYKVLCRSGWLKPSYIYRHKTDKNIYEVSEGDMIINVTEDHSLFDSHKTKINPKNITETTKLEYYTENIQNKINEINSITEKESISFGKRVANGEEDRVPLVILNSEPNIMKTFYDTFMDNWKEDIKYSKTCLAGLQYLKRYF